jgi:Protein of unknown function DUF58
MVDAGRRLRDAGARRIPSLRPTARGVAALVVLVALGVAEAVTGRSGLLPFVVVVGLPLVAGPVLVAARSRRAAAAQVRAMVSPPLAAVGGPSELIVQLANEGTTTLPPVSLDAPADHWATEGDARPTQPRPPGLARRRDQLLAPDPGRLIRWSPLAGDGSSTSALGLPTSRRGVFVIGPLRAWVHDPFGLFAKVVALAPAVTLVVHPPPSAAAPSLLAVAHRLTAFGGGTGDIDQDDPSGELSSLRPYVAGDRLHLLSWPVEARYGTLMVQQFRPDGQARIGLVLDDRAGVHRRAAFESALSMIHGLAAAAADRGLDVEITTLSGRHVVVAATPDGRVEFLTFLARAQPRSVTPARVAAAAPPSASAVVTTSTARATLPFWPGALSVVEAE